MRFVNTNDGANTRVFTRRIFLGNYMELKFRGNLF